MSGPRMTAEPSRIEGRTPDGWVVSGRLYPPALLITATTVESLGPLVLEALDADALPPLKDVDLLLLGTGPTMHRPTPVFVAGARTCGLRIEAMDSSAAARTFNVLVAEERRVAVLLL